MITALKIFLIGLWIWMVYVVVSTWLASNLFTEWSFLGSIPWMQATLWDFYANIILIFIWVCYKEKSKLLWLLWAVLFFCLGSIATIAYVLIQLFKLREGDSLQNLFVKQR
jgi:hypothetical protein